MEPKGPILLPSVDTALDRHGHSDDWSHAWASLPKVLFLYNHAIKLCHPLSFSVSQLSHSLRILGPVYTSSIHSSSMSHWGRLPMSLRLTHFQSALQWLFYSFYSSTPTTFIHTKETHFYGQQQYANCSASKILNYSISTASSYSALSFTITTAAPRVILSPVSIILLFLPFYCTNHFFSFFLQASTSITSITFLAVEVSTFSHHSLRLTHTIRSEKDTQSWTHSSTSCSFWCYNWMLHNPRLSHCHKWLTTRWCLYPQQINIYKLLTI